MTSLLDNPLDFGALTIGAVRFPTNASNAIATIQQMAIIQKAKTCEET